MSEKRKKGVVALASVSAMSLMLAGCGAANNGANSGNSTESASSGKPQEGGSIVLDESQGLKDLDPALAYDTQSWEVVQELNDQLVTYAKGTNNTKIIGMDAKKWTVSKNKKTYTFHLRSGLEF